MYSKSKGGNFIYPMMHRFILFYQASERTWSYQFNRDATVEQRWKATCFADKTFFTFAVLMYLQFSFYCCKYISCYVKESVLAADYELTSLTIARQSTQMKLQPVAKMLRHSHEKQPVLLQIAVSHRSEIKYWPPPSPHSKLFLQLLSMVLYC